MREPSIFELEAKVPEECSVLSEENVTVESSEREKGGNEELEKLLVRILAR